MNQEQVLSYSMDQVKKKIAAWFKGIPVELWNGKLNHAIYLVITDVWESNDRNQMETLKVLRNDKKIGDVEVQVPVPRMVSLSFSIVPVFKDITKSLNAAALLSRNIHDDPYLDMNECNWHGNESGKTLLEIVKNISPVQLPSEMSSYQPYCWEVSMQLGINSAKEEKITRVIKRQFTAVNK